jgi:tetratricopeptide (TPR) repeat protein
MISHPVLQSVFIQHSSSAVRQWFASLDHEWLLIFDGADCEPNFLSKYLPAMDSGNIIISTRNPSMRRLVKTGSLEILDLSEPEAIKLLLLSADLDPDSPDNQALAALVVRELCSMPLAVDQAGAAIASGLSSLSHYLSIFHKHRLRLMDDQQFQLQSEYGRALYTTWDISFQEIQRRGSGISTPQGNQCLIAIMLLRVFSLLHFEEIPEEMFDRAATSNVTYRDDWVMLLDNILSIDDDGQWNPLHFRGGIQVLRSFSFVKSAGLPFYTMHRLVHDWVRDRMSEEECATSVQIVGTLFKLSIPHDTDEHIPFCQTLVPHITGNMDLMEKLPFSSKEVDDNLLMKSGNLLQFMGFYHYAFKCYSSAFCFRESKLGPEHVHTLVSMNSLASAYSYLGEYQKAEALHSEVLEVKKRVLGPEHVQTLVSMNDLAWIYRNLGEYKKAWALQSQELEISRRVRGPEHVHTLVSMNNLAMTYFKLGQYQKAEALHSQVLEMRKRVLGAEHVETLVSMNNLALTYHNLGEYKKAEALHSQALEIRKQVLGPKHVHTLDSMNNLASTYSDLGEYQKAEALHSQVLEAKKQVLGPEHVQTLTSMSNLASTYNDWGQYQKAEALQSQVLEVRKRVLGPEHVQTLTSTNNLAFTYSKLGEHQKAEALHSQVLEVWKRVLGPEHVHTLASMNNLAMVYCSLGEYQKATALHSQVLEMRKRVLGPRHVHTLNSMNNLASTYIHLGEYQKAAALLRS